MPNMDLSCVGIFKRLESSKAIAPEPAFSNPMMLFMSVVLPAPLRPMRPVMLPVGSSSETSRRICTDWIDTLSASILSMDAHDVALHFGIGERSLRRRVGDDAAVVEGEDARGEAAHHFHVVLDEQHRDA